MDIEQLVKDMDQAEELDVTDLMLRDQLRKKKRAEILSQHTVIWNYNWIDPVDYMNYLPSNIDVISMVPHLYPVKILSVEPYAQKCVWYTHGKQKLWWEKPKRLTFDFDLLKVGEWYVIQDIHVVDYRSHWKTMYHWLDAVRIPAKDAVDPERYLKDWESLHWLSEAQKQYEASEKYKTVMKKLQAHIKNLKRKRR